MKASPRQRGAALIALLLILALGASAYLLSSFASINRTAEDRTQNAEVLQQAKAALIGWAALQAVQSTEETPGRLPCPEAAGNVGDPASEGIAASNCTLPAVGRLPWRTLGLPKLLDASGEPLWYAVSAGWARPNSSTLYLGLNSNSVGQLTVDNVSGAAAALIIAPGPAITVQASANCSARQQRRTTPSSSIDLRDYLECQNATKPADATFATSGPADSFNDQVVQVTARDVWSVVEGAVSKRITRDVLPTLQGMFGASYAAAQWGTTATTPVLPFAAPFANSSTSAFQGALNTAQGLMPIARSQSCTPGTDPLCDTGFVNWNTAAAITATQTGGTAFLVGSDCTASTSAQLSCTLSYWASCLDTFSGTCTGTLSVSVQAEALNVGMALRSLSTTGITNLSSPSITAPLGTTGTASSAVSGSAPNATCTKSDVGSGYWFCSTSKTVTITVPIGVFADHASLTAFWSSASLAWFVQNKWYQLMYYAVSPAHLPSAAAHDCRSSLDCLTVSGAGLAPDLRASVAFMGYSLSGATRPSGTLGDYLDSTENRNGDTAFEQKKIGRSFNDRFYTLSSY